MSTPFRTEAIILRRTNYGEVDRVVSLITPDRGKISGIAKGVRKPKSKLAGGLELLAVCDLTLIEGRGNMALITSARMNEFYGDILRDYDRMQLAYEMIKITNKAAETVGEPEFYYLLRGGLQFLNNAAIDWRITELWFRLNMQTLLGHGMNLATDREDAKLAADKTYHFDFGENAFFVDGRGQFTAEHIKLLRLAAAKNPAVLRQVGGIGDIIEDCLWLLRTLEQ
jgi:DNA repair protein RecO (recombination protein O)